MPKIAPFDLFLGNEFGTKVVIFSNLMRGKFHFLSQFNMNVIRQFKSTASFPAPQTMRIYDTTSELQPLLEDLSGEGPNRKTDEYANAAVNQFINHWLNVWKRGEYAREHEVLTLRTEM